MDNVHLESWVRQQFCEIGFGPSRDGPFIGRTALKNKLISRYPQHKLRIRQIVNSMDPNDKPRKLAPQLRPTVSQTEHTPQPPVTPSPPTAPLALRSKITSQTSFKQQAQPAPPTPTSKVSSTNSHDVDSGFASSPVDTEDDTDDDTDEDINQASSRPTKHPAAKFQNQLPRLDGGGGAALRTTSSPTVLNAGKATETLAGPENTKSGPSNLKILELKKFLDVKENAGPAPQSKAKDPPFTLELQLSLLHAPSATEEDQGKASPDAIRNAVLFSANMLSLGNPARQLLPQYGILGSSVSNSPLTTVLDSRLFLNTNIPFSAFVCGVQGSGKSHTTACMVENCLIPSPVLGVLQKPLSALVFNFAEYSSNSSFRPCELAFLASPSPELPGSQGVKKVNVLVSPSNYPSLKKLYSQISGVSVQPFMLRPENLNISTMLTLMSVDQTQSTPLYMGIVTKILRNMASASVDGFNYLEFRRHLEEAGLDRRQEEFLTQRLDLLESFLDLDGSTTKPEFAAGEITIIDLSCPFVDASTACVLFKIGMGLYLESDSAIGKVIVLDEAHKYMTDTPASKALTDSLMGVIRQQRHYGARVIISTQEPSISTKLIDLCSITVMHRFSSPEWLSVLKKHILVSDEDGNSVNGVSLLRDIMKLKTGEALVFAPSAMIESKDDAEVDRAGLDELLRMRMRKRVTWDGGKSIVCI